MASKLFLFRVADFLRFFLACIRKFKIFAPFCWLLFLSFDLFSLFIFPSQGLSPFARRRFCFVFPARPPCLCVCFFFSCFGLYDACYMLFADRMLTRTVLHPSSHHTGFFLYIRIYSSFSCSVFFFFCCRFVCWQHCT